MIMSWENWPKKWRDLDLTVYRDGCLTGKAAHDWIEIAIRGDQILTLPSLSDGDVALWAYKRLVQLPEIQKHWLDRLCHTTGCFQDPDDFLIPLIDSAFRNSSAWLIQTNWDIAARLSYVCMQLMGVEVSQNTFTYGSSKKLKIDCEAMYSFIESDRFLPAIKEKRIAILSGFNRKLEESLLKSKVNVIESINFPKSRNERKLPAVDNILCGLFKKDWDLLLCCAGSLSSVFCEYAASRGRQAIDIGSGDTFLISGKRNYDLI